MVFMSYGPMRAEPGGPGPVEVVGPELIAAGAGSGPARDMGHSSRDDAM